MKADTSLAGYVVWMFERTSNEFEEIAGLVNNVAIYTPRGCLDELSNLRINTLLRTYVLGSTLCLQAAIDIKSTNSDDINGPIASVSGGSLHLGAPTENILYAASKAATKGLPIGLSQEVARKGIHVNTVGPGFTKIKTSFNKHSETLGPETSVRTSETAKKNAQAIVWLLLNPASCVNDGKLCVNGSSD